MHKMTARAACILVALLGLQVVAEGRGLGDRLIMDDGAVLLSELGAQTGPQDTVFSSVELHEDDHHDQQLMDVIRLIGIDVVDPGRDLMKMMNLISTKTRAMFLQDYEKYFRQLDVGSTSRPMLVALLGLRFASQDQINSWYASSRPRIKSNIVKSCQMLAMKRQQAIEKSLDANQSDLLKRETSSVVKQSQATDGLHLAYLVFKSNMNLFMLENYLYLCTRLEPSELSVKVDGLQLLV